MHPEILYALGALAIPIIVHLFNFRRFKRVYFPNVAFLKEIQVETQSRSRLRHLLILISRLLALACIILAFAQPYVPLSGKSAGSGAKAVSVYLDNSFSLEGEVSGAPAFEISRNKAIEIVQGQSPGDQFQVITNDFEGRHQRLVSRDEALELLKEARISPATRLASEVYARQRDALSRSTAERRVAFQVTDLQATVADYGSFDMDTSIRVRIVPTLTDPVANIAVDSAWFVSPVHQVNQPEELVVRLTNHGTQPRENIPVELLINDQQKGVSSASVDAGASAEVRLTFTHLSPGFQRGVVRIGDYPVTFDDTYYFSYEVRASIPVMCIAGNGQTPLSVKAVFEGDPYFTLTEMTAAQIDYSRFPQQQFIILDEIQTLPSGLISEIERFVTNGGSVLVIPADDADFTSYNDLLGRLGIGAIQSRIGGENQVSAVDYEHPLFRQAFERSDERVDLPRVSTWYVLAPGASGSSVMGLQTNTPFLTAAHAGNGLAYFVAVSTGESFSGFTRHALFPASLIRMAELSQPSARLEYTLGRDQSVLLRNISLAGEETFRIRSLRGELEFIPEHRNAGGNTEVFIHSDLSEAGHFSLYKGDREVSVLAFNYDRRESATQALDEGAIASVAAEKGWTNLAVIGASADHVGKLANDLDEGQHYWWSLMIWALIFLAIEILLIKYWR